VGAGVKEVTFSTTARVRRTYRVRTHDHVSAGDVWALFDGEDDDLFEILDVDVVENDEELEHDTFRDPAGQHSPCRECAAQR
jgi:hypothetical protein